MLSVSQPLGLIISDAINARGCFVIAISEGKETPKKISLQESLEALESKLDSHRIRVARLKSIKIPHQDLKNPRMQHIFSKNPEVFFAMF